MNHILNESLIFELFGEQKNHISKKRDFILKDFIIPDTCMDIIFEINYSKNRINNKFCGVNDSAFLIFNLADSKMFLSTFGIRFYAWSDILFSEEFMKDVKNINIGIEYYFSKLKKEIEKLLFEVTDIKDRIAITEKYLLKQIRLKRKKHIVIEAVLKIL